MKKMTEKERLLLEIFNSFSGSIESNRKSAIDIVDTTAEMINTVFEAKIQFPQWKVYIETLIFKLIFNSYTLINLSKGFSVSIKKELKGDVIDYSSMFTLTRTLIENYLTLYYIYIEPKSESEKIFRFKLWEASGLISRQNYNLPNSKSDLYDKAKQTKENERQIIEKIMQEIKEMEEFNKLEKKELNKLKSYGLPRIDSWHTLIDKSNLKKEFFGVLYSLFSNYSHSEYLSILQIKLSSYSIKNEHTLSNTRLCLNIVKILNSLTIDYLVKDFKSVELIYNTKPISITKSVEFSLKLGRKN